MYKVTTTNDGSLVVHINNKRHIFKAAQGQTRKHLLNVHQLATKAFYAKDASPELEQANTEKLVKTLLGNQYSFLKRMGNSYADDVATIVFRWNIAGLPAAHDMAQKYNAR